jgi:predicted RNA-binding Zn ribbon-like protein
MLIPAARADLCLDYANTLAWRGSPAPEESLHRLDDLLDWLGRDAGGLADAQRQAATPQAATHQAEAAALFAEALRLRETIYRIFAAQAAGDGVAAGDVAVLNRALGQSPPRARLMPSAAGYAWQATATRKPVSAPTLLAPVLWSAGDLLARPDDHRIRRCANAKCLWLFLDRSKAGTRRWCDMAACGNRAKAQRHYRKVTAS